MSDPTDPNRQVPAIRVFPSSPSDVQDERAAVSRVIARLGVTYAEFVDLQIDPWESHFYEANRSFQQGIEAMSQYDVVVGVLWKRIGTPLSTQQLRRADGSAYESGTAFEIETALESAAIGGRPSVLVFRRTTPVLFTEQGVDAERAQKSALDAWWNRTFRDAAGSFVRGYQEYDSVETFEQDLETALVEWMVKRKTIPAGPMWNIADRGSPYPGLIAYNERWASVYFGRSLAVAQALDELLSVTQRPGRLPVLFIVGPSGCGKSSLALAGLVPRIMKGVAGHEQTQWRVCVVPPSKDALNALAWQLFASAALPELVDSPQKTPQGWIALAVASAGLAVESIAWAIARAGQASGRNIKLLVVIDQVESLVGDVRAEPIAAILLAICAQSLGWVVATLRSDKYEALIADAAWRELKARGSTFDLPLPGRAEMTDIVYGPARAAGLRFEESGTRSVARELIAGTPGPDALPLLQMTLNALFSLRNDHELTLGALDSIHGIDGAIASYADSVLKSIDPVVAAALPTLLQLLVAEVGTDHAGHTTFSVRSVVQDELANNAQRSLTNLLVDAFLLVRDRVGNLRLAHEALIRQWAPGRQCLESLLKRKRQRKLAWLVAVSGVPTAVLGIALFASSEDWVQLPVAARAALGASHRPISCEVRHDGSLWYAFRIQQDYALGFRNHISQVDDALGRPKVRGAWGRSGVVAPYQLERKLFPLAMVDQDTRAFSSVVDASWLRGRRGVNEPFVGGQPGGPTLLVQTLGHLSGEVAVDPDEHRPPLPGWGALVVVRTGSSIRQSLVEGLVPTWSSPDERGDPRSPASAVSMLAVSEKVIWLGVRSPHSRAPGGLWLSRDGGASWERQTGTQSVAGLAVIGTGRSRAVLVASPAHDDLWSSIVVTTRPAGLWRIDPEGGQVQPLTGLVIGDKTDVELCGVLDSQPLVRVDSNLMLRRTVANWQRMLEWWKTGQGIALPPQKNKQSNPVAEPIAQDTPPATADSRDRASTPATARPERSSSSPGKVLSPAAAWPFPTGNKPPAAADSPDRASPPASARPERSSSSPGTVLSPAAAWLSISAHRGRHFRLIVDGISA